MPSVYATNQTIASIDIEPGTYILVGFVDLSTGDAELMNAQLGCSTPVQKQMLPNVRTAGVGGGGASVVGFIETSESNTIYLKSHSYYNGTYHIRGTLSVIRVK